MPRSGSLWGSPGLGLKADGVTAVSWCQPAGGTPRRRARPGGALLLEEPHVPGAEGELKPPDLEKRHPLERLSPCRVGGGVGWELHQASGLVRAHWDCTPPSFMSSRDMGQQLWRQVLGMETPRCHCPSSHGASPGVHLLAAGTGTPSGCPQTPRAPGWGAPSAAGHTLIRWRNTGHCAWHSWQQGHPQHPSCQLPC